MSSRKVAFIFPGQGAQYVGMGEEFYRAFTEAKEVFWHADDLLGRPLSQVVLEGPDEELTMTRNSQAGIYVTSLAILRVIQEQFPRLHPAVCAGLSLGEYTAMTAADHLSFQEGLALVEYRGEFMNDACQAVAGGMSVVMGLSAEEVEGVVREVALPEDLWVANFNCPGQVVISGTIKGIEVGSELAKARGAKRVLPLQVHGAFHSGLMRPAQARFAEKVGECCVMDSPIPVVMNVSGEACQEAEPLRLGLVEQITSPVRWQKSVETMVAMGVDLFVEVGCGKTLTGLNKRIGVKAPTLSVERVADLEALAAALS